MNWIEQQAAELAALNETIESEFGEMAAEKMDMKPDPKTWSINECFDHIIQTNRKYYDIFDSIEQGTYDAGRWVHFPVLPRFLGRMVLKVVSPDYKGKSKTVSVFYPLKSEYGRNLTADLLAENQILTRKLGKCREEDLDRTIVASPANGFITYSLRDCIKLLVDHEKRHHNQAATRKAAIENGPIAHQG